MGRTATIAGQRHTLYDVDYVEQRLIDAAEVESSKTGRLGARPKGLGCNTSDAINRAGG